MVVTTTPRQEQTQRSFDYEPILIGDPDILRVLAAQQDEAARRALWLMGVLAGAGITLKNPFDPSRMSVQSWAKEALRSPDALIEAIDIMHNLNPDISRGEILITLRQTTDPDNNTLRNQDVINLLTLRFPRFGVCQTATRGNGKPAYSYYNYPRFSSFPGQHPTLYELLLVPAKYVLLDTLPFNPTVNSR